MKPKIKPANANFSSGPCAKRPGWSLDKLQGALTGRSHRSKPAMARINEVIDLSREILGLPKTYYIGIVPGSDTGAVEMAMWSLLGPRGVDVLAWESFGSGWVSDIAKQLRLKDIRIFEAGYGKLPNLAKVDPNRDIVFTWNGTTSGVRLPDAEWISDERNGLTICDATSAVFAMNLPWKKLDVVTYSWQKVLGGEGAHGILILSPRAVARLENYTPPWPMPKLFRMTKGGKFEKSIFEGSTINTPSMLCIEDALDSLKWAKKIGGLKGLVKRSEDNLKVIKNWVKKSDWADFLAEDSKTISCTSICIKIVDKWYTKLSPEEQQGVAKKLVSLLDKEEVAYDIGAYRDAPPGLRIWGGATVEKSNIEALLPWLDWAWKEVSAK